MKDGGSTTTLREELERREAALVEAWSAVLELPNKEAAPIGGFAAGLMAAHLADVAALDDPAQADAAREALQRLHDETGDLLQSLDEAGRGVRTNDDAA